MVAAREDADAPTTDASRRACDVPDQKGFVMATDLDLISCSLCLRVRRGSEWLEAERVIKEIRSYELDAPPRLRSAVCDECSESIFRRRAQVVEPAAA
jgi:hypothetical protein